MAVRSSLEKSPVDSSDYEGLQVDTRAKDNKDPVLDDSKPQGLLDDDFDDAGRYLNEKQAHLSRGQFVEPRSPESVWSPGERTATFKGSPLPPLPSQFQTVDNVFRPAEIPPAPRERRICGLKRKHFWELFGLILALVIAAAVVGGVVGGLQYKNASPASPAPAGATNGTTGNSTTPTNGTSAVALDPALSADVLADSPVNVISYDAGGNGDPNTRQSFRVYYQSVIGNIKEAVSSGQTSWQAAAPIFTDALNNTGLASVVYLNDSSPQATIFYVGRNGLVQEKRKLFNNTEYWAVGAINALCLPAVGNISLPSGSAPEPTNGIGSYAMAAVYSTNFSTGAGIRLFYHAELLNGTTFIQEMIWVQASDQWTKGAEILNVWPNSKLSATIDESNSLLRLFFTTGSETLQELYYNITDPHGGYQSGFAIQNYLYHNTADLSVVSVGGTTYVYHYATVNQAPSAGIHELAIRGIPGSNTNKESYNLTESLVSSPQLALPNNGQAPFQPLAAVRTVVPGVSPGIFVFWSDKVTGDPQGLGGYRTLSQTSRLASNPSWSPTAQPMVVPLGENNTQPYHKRLLRRLLRWLLR